MTGTHGRLGRALVAALSDAPFPGPAGPIAWSRPDYDLDDPTAAARLVRRDRPEVVVHAAAWTDVDGCARDQELASRRNGDAAGELAAACFESGADFVLVSTNEVFDGRRTDGTGYAPTDRPSPANPYAASKLRGETLAGEAFGWLPDADLQVVGQRRSGADADRGVAGSRAGGPQLAIVRTAWLYGPPGNDFPSKILAAADRALASGDPVRVVADEVGSPTFSVDLAGAIVELIGEGKFGGIHQVVNGGIVTRADWAREVFRRCAVGVDVVDVQSSEFRRDSTPPRWAVLDPTPLPGGERLRPWQLAFADYVPGLIRRRASLTSGRTT